MNTVNRPLSPYLQIYRWTLTMTLSITHRASGILLSVGSVALAFWLVAAALGPGPYAAAQGFFSSPVGIALLMLWSWSLFLHLCSGIRHLVWDTGRGFDLSAAYAGGWAVVIISTALTVATWVFGLILAGGGA